MKSVRRNCMIRAFNLNVKQILDVGQNYRLLNFTGEGVKARVSADRIFQRISLLVENCGIKVADMFGTMRVLVRKHRMYKEMDGS